MLLLLVLHHTSSANAKRFDSVSFAAFRLRCPTFFRKRMAKRFDSVSFAHPTFDAPGKKYGVNQAKKVLDAIPVRKSNCWQKTHSGALVSVHWASYNGYVVSTMKLAYLSDYIHGPSDVL
ncbi:hypothetical protein NC651_034588 [Populus alba x Populus x berolinensis]|nr:hypothetical protein NC651_034588 [Populus alba x Populus x berolinensis]